MDVTLFSLSWTSLLAELVVWGWALASVVSVVGWNLLAWRRL